MSGFLARLAASAAAPAQRLHPAVLPLYAAAPQDNGVFVSEASSLVGHREEQSGEKSSVPTARRGSVVPFHYETMPHRTSDEVSVVSTLRAPERAEARMVAETRKPVFASEPDSVMRTPEASSEMQADRVEPSLARREALLVPVSEQPAILSATGEALPTPTSSVRSGEAPSLLRQAGSQATGTRRESQKPATPPSDDVHIHIGRIEVIAAAPQTVAARPAAQKTLRLEDYLKRQNGRAR